MGPMMVRGLAVGMTLLLAGCGGPRGAALTSEVIDVKMDESGRAVDEAGRFAVYAINSNTLPQVSSWPIYGANTHSWIRRQPQSQNQVIAAGDKVTVSVWDAEENSLLTGTGGNLAKLEAVQVAASGNINLPFIGNVQLSGLSTEAARNRIEELYSQTIPSAQVQLSVEPGRGNAVNLVSGVGTPGVFPMPDQDVTILSLLAMGGGIQASLVNPQIKLMRGNSIYGISAERLMANPDLDTTLRGGDRVMVEADKRMFLALGSTGTQARYSFVSDQMSALDALSEIGGVAADRADINGIMVLRQYPASAIKADGSGPPNARMIFTLDMTSADGLFSAGKFKIMEGDVIYATQDRVVNARTSLGIFTSVLSTARSF